MTTLDAAPRAGGKDPPDLDPGDLPDVSHLQESWEATLDQLMAAWGDLEADQKAQLVAAVRQIAEQGQLTDLDDLTVPSEATAVTLAAAMIAISEEAAGQVAEEAAEQGATVPPVPAAAALLAAVAIVVAAVRAGTLAAGAALAAMRANGPGATVDDVADAVEEHLDSLSPDGPRPLLGGALTGAQNAGRIETFRNGPEAALYANERNDKNTCLACREINGRWLGNNDDMDQVLASYPAGAFGGYIACLGRERCRGTVTGVWRKGAGPAPDPEPEPPDPEPLPLSPTPEPEPDDPPAGLAAVLAARDRFADHDPPAKISRRDDDGNVVPTDATKRREQVRLDVGAAADKLIEDRLGGPGWWTRREYQTELLRLLDEAGIKRGGDPRDIFVNFDDETPAHQARLLDALARLPSAWLARITGDGALELVHDDDQRAWVLPRQPGVPKAKLNLPNNAAVDVAVHELSHQCEATNPEITLAEWAWYWLRCEGEDLVGLAELTGISTYGPSEKARPDEWMNPYMGKGYVAPTRPSLPHANHLSNYELLSMVDQVMLGPIVPGALPEWEGGVWESDDARQWLLSLLLTVV